MAGTPTIAVAALAGLLLAGLMLLIIGWRGRRIDEHPLCRRCGYDLLGCAQALNCPECGRDLQRRRGAIRIGHRRRRWITLSMGVLLVLLALGGGGLTGFAAARNFDWNTIKPLALLRREAVGSHAVRKQKAQSEIIKRLVADRLSQGQINSLADEALALQADANVTWDAWWGDFVDTGWRRSQISRARFERYVHTAIDAAAYLRVRRSVHPDVRTRIDVMLRPLRAGNRGISTLQVHCRGDALVADGRKLSDVLRGSALDVGRQPMGGDWSMVAASSALLLPPGPHPIAMEVEFMFSDGGAPSRLGSSATQTANPHWSISASRSIQAPIEILADDAASVRLVPNVSLAEQLRASISPSLVVRTWFTPRPSLVAFIDFQYPRVNVAFDVIVRDPATGRAINLGGVWAALGDRHQLAPWVELNDEIAWVREAGRIEIILRPSVAAAESTWNLYDIWDGELRYPGVTVEQSIQNR